MGRVKTTSLQQSPWPLPPGLTLAQELLDQACGTEASLPPGLTLKACPPWVAPSLNRRTAP